jgi:hypothetical protein
MANFFPFLLLCVLLSCSQVALAQTTEQSIVGTSTASSTSLTVSVSATGSANLLVVAAANNGTRTVTSISDGTSNFTKINASASCTGSSCLEFWYLPKSNGGKTSVTITYSGAAGTFTKTGLFWEASGYLNPKPYWPDNVDTGTTGGATTIANLGFDCNEVSSKVNCFLVGAAIVATGTVTQEPANTGGYDNELRNTGTTVVGNSSRPCCTGGIKFDTSTATAYTSALIMFTDAASGIENYNSNSVSSTALTNTITVPATTAGSLLVVAVTNNQGRTISSISDGTNTYLQATNAQAANGNYMSDVWYVPSSAAGITSITVTYSGSVGATIDKDIFYWEVTGFQNATLDGAASLASASSGDHTGASVTPTGYGFGVGVMITNSGDIQCPGYGGGNPFLAGGGADTTTAGCSSIVNDYAPKAPVFYEWNGGSKTFASSTVLFKEAAPLLTSYTMNTTGTISSTGNGNLLVVGMIADNNATTTAVSAGGQSLIKATGSDATYGTDHLSFWYLRSTTAGITSVVATAAGAANKYYLVWEVSGVKNGTLDVAGGTSNSNAVSNVISGPSVTTTTNTEFIAAFMIEADYVIENPLAGSPFTAGGQLGTDGAVSMYTTAAGTYTPQWRSDQASSLFSASTAAFKIGTDCISPAGAIGQIQYNSGKLQICTNNNGWMDTDFATGSSCTPGEAGKFNYTSGAFYFCNGANWMNMKGASLGTCSAGSVGALTYDSVADKLKFCDGANWYSSTAKTCTFTLTSGSSWSVPSDFNSNSNSVSVLGGGGGGGSQGTVNGGGGGGGGAFTKVFNVTLTPSSSVNYALGTAGSASNAGGDSYFCNATSNCASIAGTAVVAGAKGGSPGSTSTGGAGGLASGAVAVPATGAVTYNGGSGSNNVTTKGGGGGGAAGINGAGGDATTQVGAQGDNGTGGSGGSANSSGSAGTEWDGTLGSGGGGSGGNSGSTGKAGGNYGAGGGGGGKNKNGGAGKAGLIMIQYKGTTCN